MLRGKIAFITGGNRGIGWAIAKKYAENGCIVIINGKSNEKLLKERLITLKRITDLEHDALLFDVSNPVSVKDNYHKIFSKYKKLDILVNNAGVMKDSSLLTINGDIIYDTYSVNVNGMIYNMQYAIKLMQRNNCGTIINISSILGVNGGAGQIVYAGSKAAVIGMTKSAAKELAGKNIRANAIAPGFIDTDLIEYIPQAMKEKSIESIKMGRIGEANDVANAALFFASELSSYVTGQVLGVDGGMLI
jgi:3-oxoacyl-[acyl-carrier protein] reductase